MNKMNKKQQQRDTTSLKNIVFFLKMYFSHMFFYFMQEKNLLVLSKTIQNKLKPWQNKKEWMFVDQIYF